MSKNSTRKNKTTKKQDLPAKRSLFGKFIVWIVTVLIKRCANINHIGLENLPDTIPYIVTPNHQTYIDGLIVANGLPKDHFEHFSALIGADLKTEHGLVGKLIQPVARGVEIERYGNPVRGLVMACRVCRAGNILLVHPEGTRTHDGLVAPLQNGAAYISIKCKAPLIPVYIEGGFEVFSRYDKLPRFRNPLTKKKFEINVIYGQPLDPANYEDANDFTAALTAWFEEKESEYLVKNAGKLRKVETKQAN